MKKIIFYALGAAALALTSCQVLEETFNTGLTAIMETAVDTKTSLSPAGDEAYNVLWSDGDKIGVYIDDNTTPSTFTLSDGAGEKVAHFYGEGSGSSYMAVYPLSVISSRDGYAVNIDLPKEQNYVPGTFDDSTFPMVAISTTSQLQFRNLCSIIRISLTGSQTVSKIVFRPNDPAVRVSGAARVDFPLTGEPVLTMAEDACDSLVLNTGNVQLTETATDFYLVLPPQTYTGGFTVRVYSGDDCIEKSCNSDITLRRSMLRRAAVFSFDKPVTASKYLTFTSEGETTVRLDGFGSRPLLYYSFDAENWMQWDYSQLTFTSESPLYMCGDNPDGFNSQSGYSRFYTNGSPFAISGDIMSLLDRENDMDAIPRQYCFYKLFHDCWMLTSAPDLPATTLADFCYSEMFERCLNLVSTPALPATELADYCYSAMFKDCESLISASDLPATALAEFCYSDMFSGCTSLATAPALPATTLATYCYYNMFKGCTSLTAAPALPATTLARACYYNMFSGCTSLATVPETLLPAVTMEESCYQSMFEGCTGLTAVPALPSTTLAAGCYMAMFAGCTSLASAPALPATTLDIYCYAGMFDGCSSLTTAPSLPAAVLCDYCYSSMFANCSALNYVECLATDINYTDAVNWWLVGVAETGTFVKAGSMTDWPSGDSGIPDGWTVENVDAATITANKYLTFTSEGTTTIRLHNFNNTPLLYYSYDAENWTQWDYSNLTFTSESPLYMCGDNPDGFSSSRLSSSMFFDSGDLYGISGDIMSLLDKENDMSVIPQQYCFYQLFNNCWMMKSAPDLPATTLTDFCYQEMFSKCLNLISAPALPATELEPYCYQDMFRECESLVSASDLPATALAEFCCIDMFYGCTSLATAPALPATTLARSCYYDMFKGCTSLTAAPDLPATAIEDFCYYGMFSGCTSLETAPETLPALTMKESCYQSMFSDCASLTTAPALPSTALASACYMSMFDGCTSLASAPALPATTLANYCYSGMFDGCSSLTKAPSLPAETLCDYCYSAMFMNCSSLNYVECLATDINYTDAVNWWMVGVADTGTFVKAASMTDWPSGDSGIPDGWTVVDAE